MKIRNVYNYVIVLWSKYCWTVYLNTV